MSLLKCLFVTFFTITLLSCGGGGGSISVLSVSDDYSELPTVINPKIDILWVIDPSRSMFTEVQTVQNNIDQFVSGFLDKKFDFRMGVITTAAWSSLSEGDPGKDFLNNNPFKSLHDGDCVGAPGPTAFLTDTSAPSAIDFQNLFKNYVDVYGVALNTVSCGIEGPPFAQVPNDFPSIDMGAGFLADNIFSDAAGRTKVERSQFFSYINDERSLQSLQAFLNPSALSGGSNSFSDLSSATGASSFIRDEAFLAVIFVTDEMDSSRSDLEPNSNGVADHTAEQYLGYLDELKGSRNNYKVYSIISDPSGVGSSNLLKTVAEATDTQPININSNFGPDLANISTNIIADSSFFPISCPAQPNSIVVTFTNGGTLTSVPAAPVGFIYDEIRQGLVFSSEFAPPGGSSVTVDYIPSSLNCNPSSTATVRPLTLPSDSISEAAPIGSVVGTIRITNRNPELTYAFAITPPSPNFSIDANTGEITTTSTFDFEVQNIYRIQVELNDGSSTLTESVIILITDVSDTSAMAIDDTFTINESRVVGGQNFNERVSDNDSGLDASDTHTYTINDTVACPTVGLVSGANASDVSFSFTNPRTGVFRFSVTGNLSLSAGSSQLIQYRYGLIDSGTGSCSTAVIDLTITGENQAPEVALDVANMPNPLLSIDTSGSVGAEITSIFDSTKISDLATGDTLANNSPLVSTAMPAGFHAIDIELSPASSTTLYEVSQVQLVGPTGYDYGNIVLQVIFDNGSSEIVLTREVLRANQGNTISVSFNDLVFGNKLRIVRPTESINSNSEDFISIESITITSRSIDISCFDIRDHIRDQDVPDLPAPLGTDNLDFFISDALSEGAAPGWATINNNSTPLDTRDDKICVRPPNGTNINLSLVARDVSGAIFTQVFNVLRSDGGAVQPNSAPIALLQASDSQRGGITYKRYGGRNGANQTSPFMNYVFAEPGASCSVGPGNSDVDHTELDEFLRSDKFPDTSLVADDDSAVGFSGEFYDGWDTQCYTAYEEKFTQGGVCEVSPSPGVLRPCIITGTNVYGETYDGYFAPTQTGIYRFRSQSVDNAVRLLMSPTEYQSDLEPIITGALDNSTVRQIANTENTGIDPTSSWGCSSGVLSSMVGGSGSAFRFYNYDILGDNPSCTSEFFPGNFGGGHNTSQFYFDIDNIASSAYQPNYNVANDYRDGWVFLKQGNLYAMQIRFAEGGGGKAFLFSFDYKALGASSFPGNWSSLDAVSLLPISGPDGYTGLEVPAPGGVVDYFVSSLFYDAEFDVLEYSARLVNSNGSPSSALLSSIGLNLNSSTGQLTGTLNNPSNLRIVVSARDSAGSGTSVEYLPLKFSN